MKHWLVVLAMGLASLAHAESFEVSLFSEHSAEGVRRVDAPVAGRYIAETADWAAGNSGVRVEFTSHTNTPDAPSMVVALVTWRETDIVRYNVKGNSVAVPQTTTRQRRVKLPLAVGDTRLLAMTEDGLPVALLKRLPQEG